MQDALPSDSIKKDLTTGPTGISWTPSCVAKNCPRLALMFIKDQSQSIKTILGRPHGQCATIREALSVATSPFAWQGRWSRASEEALKLQVDKYVHVWPREILTTEEQNSSEVEHRSCREKT